MVGDRRKTIKHHIDEKKLDEALRNATDEHRLRRIGFVKNLYQGDTIAEAAEREGRSESTGDRWADAWNNGGLAELMPSFGGGRPPKLNEAEQEEFLDWVRADQPWSSQEIQHLLQDEFNVEYSSGYLGEFLRNIGLSYEKPRPKRPTRPNDTNENPVDRVTDALEESDSLDKRGEDLEEGWILDDDIRTDGGRVVE